MMWTNRRLLYDKPAQLPTPIWMGSDLAIFYSYREDGRSRIGRLMFDKNLKLLDNHQDLLPLGEIGCFDCDGVMPSHVLKSPYGYSMFYSGWHRGEKGYYTHGIGMAVSKDGLNFRREVLGPMIGIGQDVPFLANSGVMVGDRMYFCNGSGWDGLFPKYHIAVARFHKDAYRFIGAMHVFGAPDQAISRPCIIEAKNQPQRAWAAYRTKFEKYKIAHWEDGNWIDGDVLPVRPGEFDSEQTAYPWVFEIDGQSVMIYNGNGYGETGIGIAEFVKPVSEPNLIQLRKRINTNSGQHVPAEIGQHPLDDAATSDVVGRALEVA